MADLPLAYWNMDDLLSITDVSGNGRVGTNEGLELGTEALVNDGAASHSVTISGSARYIVPGFEKVFFAIVIAGVVFVALFERMEPLAAKRKRVEFKRINNKKKIGQDGYSVEYWVRVLTMPNSVNNLVGDGEDSDDFFMMTYLFPDGDIRGHYGSGESNMGSKSMLVEGQTYHVVSTWSPLAAGNNAVIYINGVADISETRTRNPNAAAGVFNNNLYIGQDDREINSASFVIDEVALYDYALSPSRVAAHYAIGNNINCVSTHTCVSCSICPPGRVSISRRTYLKINTRTQCNILK